MITACSKQRLVSRSARALAGCLAFSIFVAAPRAASAQLAIAQAQSLFDQGRDLLKAGKIAEACAAFASSYKLDPVVTTLLNLADCRAKNGQLASAWGHFVEAQRLARAAGDDKLLRVATKHADKLKPRLSKLTLSVSAQNAIPGLVLMRGDEIIDPAIWNHPLPVDGGDYVLIAKAPGKRPWTTDITIKAEGDIWELDVPRLLGIDEQPAEVAKVSAHSTVPPPPAENASVPTAISTANPPPADTPRAELPSTARPALPPSPNAVTTAKDATVRDGSAKAGAPSTLRSLVLPLTFGAFAFTGGAVAFKLSGDYYYDDAKSAITQRARDSSYDIANTRRHVAFGLGSAALVCAGAATYFYFRYRSESRPPLTALVPTAALQQAGVAIVGSW